MPTTDGVDGQHSRSASAEVRLAALEVLTDALEWRLPEARWQRVADIVQAMDDALAAQDPVALDQATSDLELAGPVRIIRVGSTSRVPPSPYIRERIDRTRGALDEAAAGAARDADNDDKGSGRDRPPAPR